MVFYGAFISPPEHLKSYVRFYRTFRADLNNLSPQSVASYPDGTVDLIISFGHPVERQTQISATSKWRGAWLVGPSIYTDKYVFEDEIDIINVNFHPMGAHLILGIPLHELRNQWIPLDAIWSQDTSDLVDCLSESHVGKRINILNAFFTHRLLRVNRINDDVQLAMHLINAQEAYSITEIQNEIGISERGLQRLFRTYIGISPQASVTLHRFWKALNLITNTHRTLSEVALIAGFYDQPQMNRTFTRIAGQSPLQFLAARRDVGIVQDNDVISRLNDR